MDESASPANVNSSEFPVIPGSLMPNVEGCKKQDYWIVFVHRGAKGMAVWFASSSQDGSWEDY